MKVSVAGLPLCLFKTVSAQTVVVSPAIPEISCVDGSYSGFSMANLSVHDLALLVDLAGRNDVDTAILCFAQLSKVYPGGRFLNFIPGVGCESIKKGTQHDLVKTILNGALACEYYPITFLEEVTMGRNLALCYDGARRCETSPFGQNCCVPPTFRKCAESTNRQLAKCVAQLPQEKAYLDDYWHLRTHDVLACLPSTFSVDVVLEFFTGRGYFLEKIVDFVSKGAHIFSFEQRREDIRYVKANLNATVLDLTYGNEGIMLRMPGNRAHPAHMALAKLHEMGRPALWIVHGRPVRESEAPASHFHDTKETYKREPGDFLQVLCESFPKGARILVVLDVTYPFLQEFATLVRKCKIGAMLMFNTNLPYGTGYIRDHLLSSSNEWAEVLRWQENIMTDVDNWVDTLAEDFLPQRSVSLLLHQKFC